MRPRYSLLLVSLLQVTACQGEGSSQAAGLCANELTAIAAAADLMRKERLPPEYVVARAYAQNSGDGWKVRVPRAVPEGMVVMPAEGLVEVRKADCVSRWMPQR